MAMSLLQSSQNPAILSKSTDKFVSSSTALAPEGYRVEPKFYTEQTVKEDCINKRSSSYIFCRTYLMNKTQLEVLWKYMLISWFPIWCIVVGKLCWGRGPLLVYSHKHNIYVESIFTCDIQCQCKVHEWSQNVYKIPSSKTYLCVFIMSRTCFSVNLHAIVVWMSGKSLLKTAAISEVYVTATGFEHTTPYFVNKHSTV